MKNNLSSKKINNIALELQNGNSKAVEEFWKEVELKGSPIIEKIDEENVLITFIYRYSNGDESVIVYGSIPGYRYEENKLERLMDTDILYKTYKVINNVKFKYRFSLDYKNGDSYEVIKKNSILDPLNKRTVVFPKDEEDLEDKGSVDSYVEIGNIKEKRWTVDNINVPKGNIDIHRISYEGISRRIWVYKPYGYENMTKPCNLLVLSDGFEHMNYLSSNNALDNLIYEGKIEATVCMLIESGENRNTELPCNEEFARFVAEKLVLWVREKYNVTCSPEKTIVSGVSFGGLFASYVALKHPNVFGNIVAQSGSYWWEKGSLIEEYKNSDKLPIKVHLNVGVLEDRPYDDEPIMMDYINDMRDVLIDKGYEVTYELLESGHDYLSWGEDLGNGLINVVGNRSEF